MGVQRTPRFGAESERFDLTKIKLSSKLSLKVQKKLPRNFVMIGGDDDDDDDA